MKKNIEVIDDIICESLWINLFHMNNSLMNKGALENNVKTFTNFGLWDYNIIGDSTPVIVYEIQTYKETSTDPIIIHLIETLAKRDIDIRNTTIMFYNWTAMSHIPWHNDGHAKAALTIYLNEEWDPNWGGAFLYKDSESDDIKAIYPQARRGVLQTGGVMHHVCPTSRSAPIRNTIQIFFGIEKYE